MFDAIVAHFDEKSKRKLEKQDICRTGDRPLSVVMLQVRNPPPKNRSYQGSSWIPGSYTAYISVSNRCPDAERPDVPCESDGQTFGSYPCAFAPFSGLVLIHFIRRSQRSPARKTEQKILDISSSVVYNSASIGVFPSINIHRTTCVPQHRSVETETRGQWKMSGEPGYCKKQ